MIPHARRWIILGLFGLALGSPAAAQLVSPGTVPWNLSNITPYSGVLTPFRYQPPSVPHDYVVPYRSYIPYPVPQPVYVPVETTPARPPLEPMQVTVVTLRPGTSLPEVHVKPDGVVTWVNSSSRSHTLVIESVPAAGEREWASRQTGTARPNSSISLAFHQAGSYDYFLEDEPAHRARIVVSS